MWQSKTVGEIRKGELVELKVKKRNGTVKREERK